METLFESLFLIMTVIAFLAAVGERDKFQQENYMIIMCILLFLDVIMLKLI